MRAFGYLLFLLGLLLGLLAAFVLSAAWTEFSGRGCTFTGQCSDVVGVMVLTGCALIASAVMMFAGVVFVRR